MNIQRDIELCLISCIASRKGGVPFHEINDDFKSLTGYSIPFLNLGYPNLLSFVVSVKEIYFEKDEDNNDVLIVDSNKSRYLKNLIEKQKPTKRKLNNKDYYCDFNATVSSIQSSITTTSSKFSYYYPAKRRRTTLIHKEVLDTPIMYGHHLLGDDIFLEIAEKSLMVHVNKTAPKRCGLCITGQTIKDLIDNLDQHSAIPCRVAILIGLSDLLNNKSSREMISDMELLIYELKAKNINATIFTLPHLNCIPKRRFFALRKFNEYIISQGDENLISVMNLEEYYYWMAHKNQRPNKWSYTKGLLHKTETNIILGGIKNYFKFLNNNEE